MDWTIRRTHWEFGAMSVWVCVCVCVCVRCHILHVDVIHPHTCSQRRLLIHEEMRYDTHTHREQKGREGGRKRVREREKCRRATESDSTRHNGIIFLSLPCNGKLCTSQSIRKIGASVVFFSFYWKPLFLAICRFIVKCRKFAVNIQVK